MYRKILVHVKAKQIKSSYIALLTSFFLNYKKRKVTLQSDRLVNCSIWAMGSSLNQILPVNGLLFFWYLWLPAPFNTTPVVQLQNKINPHWLLSSQFSTKIVLKLSLKHEIASLVRPVDIRNQPKLITTFALFIQSHIQNSKSFHP